MLKFSLKTKYGDFSSTYKNIVLAKISRQFFKKNVHLKNGQNGDFNVRQLISHIYNNLQANHAPEIELSEKNKIRKNKSISSLVKHTIQMQ